MKYYILTLLSVISLALYAKGSPDNMQNNVVAWESPWVSYSNYFLYNPSATFALPQANIKEIRASYLYNHADNGLHLVQDGDGYSEKKLSSESFQQVSHYSFFGKAEYINDQKNNVAWRDVEDRSLLSPYFIADSIGGDYKREAYSLSGGASLRKHNIEWGIRGTYTGGVSYREVDPRPRNTVSVIQVNPGLSYFNGNWRFGLFGEYTRYRQNVDIQVEKENKKIFFYLLQGFGNYNRQFSILAETFTRTYKGNLFNAGFHINNTNSKQSTGALMVFKIADIQTNEADRRIPYRLKHYEIESQLTYEQKLISQTLFLKGNYNLHQTIGNETQYYPTTINTSFVVWNILTQADRYQSLNQQIQLSALLANKNNSVFSVWEQIDLRLHDSKDNYYVPDYYQNIQDITTTGTIGFNCPVKRLSLTGYVKAGYKKTLSSSLFQDENNLITKKLILPDYDFLCSDIAFYQLTMKLHFPLSKALIGNISAEGGLLTAKEKKAISANIVFALNF